MRLPFKLALVSAAAMLLHAGINAAHLNRGVNKLQSGEWTQADAEAIGGVWNLNSSRVNAATQPTTGERHDPRNKPDETRVEVALEQTRGRARLAKAPHARLSE